jgi:hypothetical protein
LKGKIMKKLIIAALFAGLGIAAFAQAPAAAAKPDHPARGRIAKLDTDKDGSISRAEAKGHVKLEKNFDAIDTNKDGKLSREELKAYRVAHKGEGKGERKVKPGAAPAGTAPAPAAKS